jgi:hypothetical protein
LPWPTLPTPPSVLPKPGVGGVAAAARGPAPLVPSNEAVVLLRAVDLHQLKSTSMVCSLVW